MKNTICYLGILVLIIALVGCDKNNIILTSGTYEMEVLTDEKFIFTPRLVLKTEGQIFTLISDPLSSYIARGTYEILDGFLIATIDSTHKYVFKIINEKTLSFDQDKSSNIITIDARASAPAYNGAKFKLKNKQITSCNWQAFTL